MPLFIILCLLTSTAAVGLVFNFEVIADKAGGLDLSFGGSTANAQNDFASTTVTVRNAPPTFSVAAAESPVSTSTSPVNVGGNIGFTANANDPENNSYYLLVCNTPGANPGAAGAAPSCQGTQFCVSGLTAIAGQASCTYNNVSDPGTEFQVWYAYVCDNHGSETACSDTYSQGANPGSGDSSSPIHVNHRPILSAVSTYVDYQNPGGTFTVRATSTDTDYAGGAFDQKVLYVCSSNSWTTSGCGGTTWCIATSSANVIDCNFATTTPARDGTFNYYAYVKDWHNFAAIANPFNPDYHVNNVAPVVSGVLLNNGDPIQLNLKTATEVIVHATGTVSDDNSCVDLVAATGTIYWSGATGAYNCAADDDECYKITGVNCRYVSGTCGGAGDLAASYTCSASLAFHALPTDGVGNPNVGIDWLGSISARDEALFGVGVSAGGVVLNTNTALEVSHTEIPYGSIRGGQDTGNYNATTTIENYGNSPLDSGIEGTDMDRIGGGDSIAVIQQKYGLGAVDYGSLTWTLSAAQTPRDILVIKPTTAQIDVTDDLYWGIAIPAGKISGNYAGENTFTAVLDDDNW